MPTLSQQLSQYNSVFLEMDKLYRDVIREMGISESVFWILYLLRTSEIPLTQADIVNTMDMPPQTVNSALKKMEREGIIVFFSSSDRRKKLLSLTADGETLAARTADRVVSMEIDALNSFQPGELRQFLELYEKYSNALKISFSSFHKEAI